MYEGMINIAGFAFNLIGFGVDMAERFSDWLKWDEGDLLVDTEWVGLALDAGILDGEESDYVWSNENKVASRELKGTHSVVIAANDQKRIRQRIVQLHPSGRQVLMKKLEK